MLKSPVLFFFVIFFCHLRPFYAEEKPIVLSSIQAYKFLIEAIAGSELDVKVFVPESSNCHHDFEPSPSQIFNAAKAKIWFQVGDAYEHAMQKVFKDKNIVCVDLRKDLKVLSLEDSCCSEHHHENEHHHDHHHADPHIWLSPKKLIIQAKTIKEALTEVFPEKEAFFQASYETICQKLKNLYAEIADLLKDSTQKTMVVSHGAFSYFCADFGLEQIAIEQEHQESGTFSSLATIKLLKKRKTKAIFLQKQHNNKAALRIAKELNLKTFIVDPQAEDYFSNLIYITKLFLQES